MHPFMYLASQSPRRSELLNQIGISHTLLVADPDEDAEALELVLPAEDPLTYVQRVTLLKLDAALARMQKRHLAPAPVLCADTTVALDGIIYGKPHNNEHAAQMLRALSGRTHDVMTAVAIGLGSQCLSACSVSKVTFATIMENDIQTYVSSGEPMGKAGAYAVQGRAAAFISHIEGSYSGIMGLPLFETSCLIRQLH